MTYASDDGPLLVHDIDMICWDATTIHGYSYAIKPADWTAYDMGSLVWTKGEAKALTSESPDYRARRRDAPKGCGLSGGYVGGELLLHDPRYVAGLSWSPPLVREAERREAWAKSPHRHPSRPVEVER